MKEDELVFLKMMPDTTAETNTLNKISEDNRNKRKVDQIQKALDYDKYKKNLADNIKAIESHDLKEAMKYERREWINKEKLLDKKGEPPQNLDRFYTKDQVDQDRLKELDDNQKKEKEKIDKENLKKEQDKKKKEEAGAFLKIEQYAGGSEQVKKLAENIEEFKSIYEKQSEYITRKDGIIHDIAKNEIIGDIEKSIRDEVDALVGMELKNMRRLLRKYFTKMIQIVEVI